VRCKTCHYSLENLTGPPHRCPECGAPFDPRDNYTFEVPLSPRQRAYRSAFKIVGWGYFLLFALNLAYVWSVDPLRRDRHIEEAMFVAAVLSVPVIWFAGIRLLIQLWRADKSKQS
jgi:hypothetical protein